MRIAIRTLCCLCFAARSYGQLSQNHPELCGNTYSTVQLPEGVSGVVDRGTGIGKIIVKGNNAVREITIPEVLDEFRQVCPIADGKLVVFASNGAGDNVAIIDGKSVAFLDSFYGRFATMSPDQHWISFLKFYPRGMEVPYTDEYLLYDLTRTAAQNRGPGASVDGHYFYVGKPAFPLGYQNIPSEVFTLSRDQEHTLSSDGFFWAADSKALVFGDRVASDLNGLNAVLIKLDEKGSTSAYTYAIPVAGMCKNRDAHLLISNAEIGPDLGGDRLIRLSFRDESIVCKPNPLDVHTNDFRPAKTEVHQPRKRLKGVVVTQ